MKPIVVAIDGYSGTGKSSTAKQVAQRLGYTYIDSGAMYRAITLFFIENKVDISNMDAVMEAINTCDIRFEGDELLLNGKKVGDKIRSMEVNRQVSQVSAIPQVREKLVAQQRIMGVNKGVVMDGRDIGTVVFPDAELKVFMTADMEVRADRRRRELQKKGMHEPLSDIIANLNKRDHVDSTRADSPLKKAPDAIEIDTSHLTLNEQVEKIVELAKSKIDEG